MSATFTGKPARSVRWSHRRQEWIIRFREGRVFDVRLWDTWQDWATQGAGYDLDDVLFRHYRPRAGDVVVDIGAGHGGETFALANLVGETGSVVAFEASPQTFKQLVKLCDLNAWPHVSALQVAVAAENGELSISESASWLANNIYEPGDELVQARTLDDTCRDLGIDRIDWLKMNIEGAEKEAIQGMEEIAPAIQNMTIACHDFLGTEWGRSKVEVLEWLTAHGFTVAERGAGDDERALRDYVYAWRDSLAQHPPRSSRDDPEKRPETAN